MSPSCSRSPYAGSGCSDSDDDVEEVEEEVQDEEADDGRYGSTHRSPGPSTSCGPEPERDPHRYQQHHLHQQQQQQQRQFAPMEVTEEAIDVDHRALDLAFTRGLTVGGPAFIAQLCGMIARSSDGDMRRDKKEIVAALDMVCAFVGASPPPPPTGAGAGAGAGPGEGGVPAPLYARVSLADLEDFGVPNGECVRVVLP